MLLQISLWVFAVIGVLAVLLILWCIIDEKRTKSDYGMPRLDVQPNRDLKREEAFMHLDNEVRGTIRRIERTTRGLQPVEQPTLKGRVDAIEEFLGLEVYVEPFRSSEIKVRKVAKRGRTTRN